MMKIMMEMFLLLLFDTSLSDQNLTVNIGQDVTFSCLFENSSLFDQVSFMHQTTGDLLSLGSDLFVDDVFSSSTSNHQMKLIRFSPNRLDLKISSVTPNDSGLYMCLINDQKLSSFSLEVVIPPVFVSFSPVEASISYPEGSSMNLSCYAHAVPTAHINWIYRSNKNKQFKNIHSGEEIFISSLEWIDSGSYECIASNDHHPSISRSFFVTVQYPPRVLIKKILHHHNETIEIQCQVCSLPLSDIHWMENEKNLSFPHEDYHLETVRIVVDEENDQCLQSTLTVFNSSVNVYSRYECQGNNLFGYQSDHVDFHSRLVAQMKSNDQSIALLILSNATNPSLNSSTRRLFSGNFIGIFLFFFIILTMK